MGYLAGGGVVVDVHGRRQLRNELLGLLVRNPGFPGALPSQMRGLSWRITALETL